jgi:hypothetical protein
LVGQSHLLASIPSVSVRQSSKHRTPSRRGRPRTGILRRVAATRRCRACAHVHEARGHPGTLWMPSVRFPSPCFASRGSAGATLPPRPSLLVAPPRPTIFPSSAPTNSPSPSLLLYPVKEPAEQGGRRIAPPSSPASVSSRCHGTSREAKPHGTLRHLAISSNSFTSSR